MTNLLTNFSIQQILLFTVLGALAFKGIVDFLLWCKSLYDKKFNKDYSAKKEEQQLQEHFENCQRQSKFISDKYDKLEHKIDDLTERLKVRMDQIEGNLELLKISDMHDIKGWIVERHHNLIKQGWVDDFTMDTLEYRYSDYKAEHGNSYIDSLMGELRNLPKFPPESLEKK